MNTNVNIDKLADSCNKLYGRIITVENGRHGASWIFDQCMRAFAYPAVVSVTFNVFLNAPVMRNGQATIGRDGSLTMQTI